jgi:hypothetical protein
MMIALAAERGLSTNGTPSRIDHARRQPQRALSKPLQRVVLQMIATASSERMSRWRTGSGRRPRREPRTEAHRRFIAVRYSVRHRGQGIELRNGANSPCALMNPLTPSFSQSDRSARRHPHRRFPLFSAGKHASTSGRGRAARRGASPPPTTNSSAQVLTAQLSQQLEQPGCPRTSGRHRSLALIAQRQSMKMFQPERRPQMSEQMQAQALQALANGQSQPPRESRRARPRIASGRRIRPSRRRSWRHRRSASPRAPWRRRLPARARTVPKGRN